MLGGRLGLPPDSLGVRVIIATFFVAVLVALDHWQQHDAQDDLRLLVDAAIGHLADGSGG